MTKIIITIIIIAALGAGVYLWVRNSNSRSADTVPQEDNATKNTAQGNQVTIQNFTFSPATLTIKLGTTVKWTNKDSAAHTIKSDTFASDTLNTGDTYEFQFNSVGSYDYFCSLHPLMKGKIIVE